MIDGGPEGLADGLVPETDTEEWDAAPRGCADDRDRRAGVCGGAGSGGDEHAPVGGDQLGRVGDGVRLHKVGVGAELVQIPDQRVDEAVVVVDDEDRRRAHRHAVTRR
ncbi:hypothetical protein D9M68_965880 [compost metagenome]